MFSFLIDTMAFKFTIFLLSCIIVDYSVSQPTGHEEAMLRSFQFVLNYYDNYNAYISQSQFLEFVGNDDNNLHYVNGYWASNTNSTKNPDKIDLEAFSKIVSLICAIHKIDVIQFLENRMATAEVIKNAYNFAFDCYNNGIVRQYLHHHDFLHFVGKDVNLLCVQCYWNAKSVPSGKTEIYLEEFTSLVNWICSKKSYDVKEFLEKRIANTEVIIDAYHLANEIYGVDGGFLQSEFLDFVGNDENNLQCVNSFWEMNLIPPEKRDNITFTQFSDLMYWICSLQEFDLIMFLKNRMEIISSKTPYGPAV